MKTELKTVWANLLNLFLYNISQKISIKYYALFHKFLVIEIDDFVIFSLIHRDALLKQNHQAE